MLLSELDDKIETLCNPALLLSLINNIRDHKTYFCDETNNHIMLLNHCVICGQSSKDISVALSREEIKHEAKTRLVFQLKNDHGDYRDFIEIGLYALDDTAEILKYLIDRRCNDE